MNMELDRYTITVFETVLDTSAIQEESIEMIVPDASPDIMRIVCATGKAYIKEKNAGDGKVDISGYVCGSVLYIAEEDKCVRKLDISLPFNRSFDAGSVTSSSKVWATAWIKNMEAREANPRKISVRANVGISVKVCDAVELELCTDVADASEYALQMKRNRVDIYAPIAMKDKSFTISDDVEMPAGSPAFASVISADANINVTDMKLIGSKAVIKGNAVVSYLYLTRDGDVASCEHELPFSQIVDVDGVSEDCRMDVNLCIKGLELDAQHDLSGEMRFLCISVLADCCVVAYYSGEIDTIEDIYSTKYELGCSFESKAIPRFSENINKRITVNETIETANTVDSVIDIRVETEPACKRRDDNEVSLTNEAVVTVMYVGEDAGVYYATRRCTIVCPLGQTSDANYECKVDISGKSHSGSGGNHINVRFTADHSIKAMTAEKHVGVTAVEIDTENCKNKQDTPSVIIKYINREQLLWETAKKYNTTVADIAAANALDNEEVVRAGSMLLIPKVK